MALLIDIPVELFHMILANLRKKDICALRLANKDINAFTTPIVFRTLRVDCRKSIQHLRKSSELVQYISASASTGITTHVRELHIESLIIPRIRTSIGTKGGYDYSPEEDVDQPLGVLLQKHLLLFVGKLVGLQTVFWSYNTAIDPHIYAQPLSNTLASLPALRHVNLDISFAGNPPYPIPPLKVFKDLHSISIKYSCPRGQQWAERDHYPASFLECFSQLPLVISASPQLFDINIDIETVEMHNTMTLQQIFPSRTTPFMKHLGLTRLPLAVNDLDIGNYLKNLKSLKLRPASVTQCPRTHWPAFWRSLRESQVWLWELDTDGSQWDGGVGELLSYLLAYRGLRALRLHNSGCSREPTTENSDAEKFWQDVVPQHADSLETLCVKAYFETKWCYGPESSSAVLRCQKLKKLNLALGEVCSYWATEKAAGLMMDDSSHNANLPCGSAETCSPLLLADASQIASLESVAFHLSIPLADRLAVCPPGRMRCGSQPYARAKRRLSKKTNLALDMVEAVRVGSEWPRKVTVGAKLSYAARGVGKWTFFKRKEEGQDYYKYGREIGEQDKEE